MGESASSRQHRLQLLARINRGRTEFKTYVEDLARLLKSEVAALRCLDLETTDQRFAAHAKQYQDSKHQPQHCLQMTWAIEPAERWLNACTRTGVALHGLKGILFVGPYEYCGAIAVDVEQALRTAHAFLDFDGDTLSLAALDSPSGLHLDRYEENSEWFVEFVIWGEWAQAITPVIGD